MSELIANKVGAFSNRDYANAMAERVRKAGASNIRIVEEPMPNDCSYENVLFAALLEQETYFFVHFDAPSNMPF